MLKLNRQLKRVEIKEFEIENEIVFNYFEKLSAEDRDQKFIRALYIGVLALMEDRISTFLSKTSNELGTELESLKMIFDMKKELFFKSSIKGIAAEEDVAEYLENFFEEHNLTDRAHLTGNSIGTLPKNKTGDIVCVVDSKPDLKIIIECKFDKSIKLGEIGSKDIFSKKSDTAWSQLIEAQANREGRVSLIVFDVSVIDGTLKDEIENVRYIPAIGFVVIVDTQRGDYRNLAIAYMLARDIAINAHSILLDKDLLSMLVNRIVKDLTEVISIKTLVQNNIDNNKAILSQLEKIMMLMEFNQRYLAKFLKDGILSKEDLLSFYSGEEVRDKYRLIEKEIRNL